MLTDVEMLTAAIRMAAEAHVGQTDKCGLPYILHPARVAARLLLETGDPVLTAVGWSHDCLEDGVYPSVPEHDFADLGLLDIVFGGEGGLALAQCATISYVPDIVPSENGVGIRLGFVGGLSALPYLVDVVLSTSPEEKVRGVLTGRVVAVVENAKTTGDGHGRVGMRDSEPEAMSEPHLRAVPEISVTAAVRTSEPTPTPSGTIREIDIGPIEFLSGHAVVGRLSTIHLRHDNVRTRIGPGRRVTLADYEAAGFSPRFLAALDAVTHRKGNETHRAYIVRLSTSEDGKTVKNRDMRDNMDPRRAYPESDGMLRKRYLPDWRYLFRHDYNPDVDGR